MSDNELKEIWNGGEHSAVINFPILQRLSDKADAELRRNARNDALTQASAGILSVASIYFYPRMYIAVILVIILGVWYVRELRRLASGAEVNFGGSTVRAAIAARMKEIRSYLWRTRIAVVISTPAILVAVYYGMGFLNSSQSITDQIGPIIKLIVIAEIAVIVSTEIYFKILYTPALKQLQNVLDEFDLEA